MENQLEEYYFPKEKAKEIKALTSESRKRGGKSLLVINFKDHFIKILKKLTRYNTQLQPYTNIVSIVIYYRYIPLRCSSQQSVTILPSFC